MVKLKLVMSLVLFVLSLILCYIEGNDNCVILTVKELIL